MKTIQFTKGALVGAALLTGSALATAGNPPACNSDSIPVQTTNWNSSVTIQKFDSALGILQGVEFQLTGTITGSAAIESLDAAPSTVVTTYQAAITLTRPDFSVLVVATPFQNFTDPLTAFDGVVDFGGTSGITHSGINVNAQETVTSTLAVDLTLFAGPAGNPGTIILPVDAAGSSTASGSGNLITQFLTDGGADVRVCYTYAPDCNGNGIPDSDDIQLGNSNDNNNDGIPDECQPGTGSFCEGDGSANGGLDCPCGNNGGPGEGCDNGLGFGGLLTASGVPSIANDTLTLTASQIPTGAPGFFFVGNSELAGGNGLPFHMGLRCVGNPVRVKKLDNGGTIPLPGAPSLSQALGALAGDTSYFQFWYRNGGGPCGSGSVNTTNGVWVTWGL